MKLIVIDLDRLKWMPLVARKKLNEAKVCTLIPRDFGKKVLLSIKKGDPAYLQAFADYRDAIFKLRDDDDALAHENKMFRKIFKSIKWYRIGVILRRDKACKILGRLLGIS